MFLSLLYAVFGKILFFTGMVNGRDSFPAPLKKEEEERYLALAQRGDKEAKDILIRHNMRLVAHVAKKYSNAGDSDDLISVGSIGLIKAINTYKKEHGAVLATYTAKCIENEILMYLRSGKKHRNAVSLSSPVGTDKDGNELSLMDILCEKEEDVFDEAERAVVNEKFNKKIKEILKEREFDILRMRYGLDGNAPLTQRETAVRLHISRSYISRIEKKAVEKLRRELIKEEFLEQ